MRKLPEETRVFIVELLLSGWLPKEVEESELVDASRASISRIAVEESIARPSGPRRDSPQRGRPRSELGPLVVELKSLGFSWRQIASELGLQSYQHAQRLAKTSRGHDGRN